MAQIKLLKIVVDDYIFLVPEHLVLFHKYINTVDSRYLDLTYPE